MAVDGEDWIALSTIFKVIVKGRTEERIKSDLDWTAEKVDRASEGEERLNEDVDRTSLTIVFVSATGIAI